VSELLHAHLPQRQPRDLQADAERLQGLSTRIKALLKVHVIVLVGAQHAFIGRVDMDKREVEVAILQRYPEES
jgi:dienelactone hydrolase